MNRLVTTRACGSLCLPKRGGVAIRVAAIVAIVAITAFASGCATSGVNRGDFNVVSLQEEWQLGAQLERDLAKQLRLVNDPSALAYVNQIGQRIVAQTELRNMPWKFHIVADPAINAFNIPGGHIYVNTGLIKQSANAAELAGVMAHEIAHGVSRHGTERITKAYGLNAVASLLLGRNPSMYQQILAQVAGTGALAKFSRSDEAESDRLGVHYMYNAGYNPEGMATMFQRLQTERQRRPSSVEQFFSTHPLTEDRIASVRKEASQLPKRSGLITRDTGLASAKQRVARY